MREMPGCEYPVANIIETPPFMAPQKDKQNKTPWNKQQDPDYAAETSKYERPVPSRAFILEHLEKRSGPATHEELCYELGLTDDDSIEALRRRLLAMRRDGQLIKNRRDGFGLIDKMDLRVGRVQGHRDGYGFFIPDDASGDWYITARQMSKVFDGDRVVVREAEFGHSKRQEAIVVEVLERAHSQIVGRYFEENGAGFVVPENQRITQDILVSAKDSMAAKPGQFVTLDIVNYPGHRSNAVGKIVEVVGDHMAPGMEIDVALRAHNIPFEWPDELTSSLKRLPKQVSEKDVIGRVDLRQQHFVTIDGEDARDFDDAVYCKARQGGGWTLYVAIADVSHYVKVDSPLDVEAQNRATSVYFPEQVIPMLPEVLSNGLCSLNPQVDRLVMVCEITLAADGAVEKYQFCEGVIHSHARLTYTKVGTMLQQARTKAGQALREEYSQVAPDLDELYRLYKVLLKARKKRGAIEFESTETRIIFGPDRKIEAITPVERNDAHKLIEECMLCANVCAADFLERHELPALYRVHEGPTAQKLENLREFLGELSLSLGGGDAPKASDYQQLTRQIKDRPDAHLIQTVMLRSMQQAVYDPDNQGHFGLAYEAYAHFTSPIRRYPDLLVHRGIRSVIRSKRKTAYVKRVDATKAIAKRTIYPYDMAAMLQLGEQCSSNERRADEAVRDVVDWLKCEYIQDRVGETFTGVISGVTAFGLFIELKDVYVEGLLHVSALSNDYYHFDPVKHRLTGERTHFSYRLGDEVEVMVARVNLDDRKIDFDLASAPQATPAKRGKKPTNKKKAGAAKSKKDVAKSKKDAVKSGKKAEGRGKKPAKPARGKTAKAGAKKGAKPSRRRK